MIAGAAGVDASAAGAATRGKTPVASQAQRAATGPAPPAPAPRPSLLPQVLLDGVGPIAWNAAAGRERGAGSGGAAPVWPAVRVLGPLGSESLYVFPARGSRPTLLASWPRQDAMAHSVRIFPRYRWVVTEEPTGSDTSGLPSERRHARFFAPSGGFVWETRSKFVPAALGRDLVLAPRPSPSDTIPPLVRVLRLPGGSPRASWPAIAGWGSSSPLENFLAANTIGLYDSAGIRQDELRLLDLEGKILWARSVAADQREFAVSNFGDVAIAREKELVVLDRTGVDKLRVAIQRNTVGRTAITPDGRFALVAATSPVAHRPDGDLWMALYETTRKTPVWSRRDLASGAGKGADVLELSLSDDGQRALVRLSTGPVLLLGSDGRLLAKWVLEQISRGEYDPGLVPRRTWLSADGTLVAFTTPVARSLPAARGWLYRVPR